MRLVDIAIDLAAVANASRSVARKHVALRGQQIDAFSQTSSVVRSLRSSSAAGQKAVPHEANEEKPSGKDSASESENGIAKEAFGADSVPSNIRAKAQQQEATEVQRQTEKPELPFKIKASTEAKLEAFQFSSKPKEVVEDFDVPTGVDVKIFHTARGSSILESIRKAQAADSKQIIGGGPVKEHPLRNWPQTPIVQVNTPSAARRVTETNSAVLLYNNAVESPQPPIPKATQLDEAAGKNDVTHGADILPTASSEGGQLGQQRDQPTYQLKESKVPSTRISRLMNYGGLAVGLFGGAVTESVSRAFGGGGEGSVLLSNNNMERLVSKLSRMRGAALKLGQMMSFQDSKMLPGPIQEVLQRVQDRADYMPAWQRDRVLASNLGSDWRDLFSEFEERPIAAASIGQVHKAVLKSSGKPVAVKIQFPGVADSINSDLDNLGILLTATKLLPRGLYLNKTIDNARLELGWECDYEREAECAKRYKELLKGEGDVFVAPDVHLEASGKQVLTMDFLHGIGVTRVKSFTQEQRDWIGTQLLRLCLREITEFKFMQTDPNWTNFLYNARTNKLELLDFGASREYPEEFVSTYVRLLDAASRSDRDAVKDLSEQLGYLTGHESKIMVEAHVKSVLTLAEPFLVSAPDIYDFKGQTITERVKALIPVMLHERLAPPPEETYSLHRKLSGAFLLCARLESKVRCRDMFVESVARSGYVKG